MSSAASASAAPQAPRSAPVPRPAPSSHPPAHRAAIPPAPQAPHTTAAPARRAPQDPTGPRSPAARIGHHRPGRQHPGQALASRGWPGHDQQTMTSRPPLLLLDVDGVLNPFAAPACPPGYTEHDFFPGEEPVRLCLAHGSWLQELGTRFQIVWASAWGPDANRLLAPLLQLPDLPVIAFPPGRNAARDDRGGDLRRPNHRAADHSQPGQAALRGPAGGPAVTFWGAARFLAGDNAKVPARHLRGPARHQRRNHP